MSIHLAFAWLKERGFVEKYNPNHYPKGSPMGGRFAPKSMSGGGGGDVVHVPYRGTRVHQKLVKAGLAKPWEPAHQPTARERLESAGNKLRDRGMSHVLKTRKKVPSGHGYDIEKTTNHERSGYGYGLHSVGISVDTGLKNFRGIDANEFKKSVQTDISYQQRLLRRKGLSEDKKAWARGHIRGLQEGLSKIEKHLEAVHEPRMTKKQMTEKRRISQEQWLKLRKQRGWD